MKLITQPDDGLTPLLSAVRAAKTSIELIVFRFDRKELEKALAAAVSRGVNVRLLIAHKNSGGQKRLRDLEQRLLAAGVTVTRTADDLPRYHGKMTIIDGVVYVLGFNYTQQDIERSRSFGVVTKDPKIVKEASKLFDADSTRQPYQPADKRFVVSPETSRERLTDFISKAKKQLLIYDERIQDKLIIRLLKAKQEAGVEIRVIGKSAKDEIPGIVTRKLGDLRLHVRAIVRDGASVFIGSQSLRKAELDARREIGVIINDPRLAGRVRATFEADWDESVVLDKAKEKKVLEGEKKEKDEKKKEEKAAMAAASA